MPKDTGIYSKQHTWRRNRDRVRAVNLATSLDPSLGGELPFVTNEGAPTATAEEQNEDFFSCIADDELVDADRDFDDDLTTDDEDGASDDDNLLIDHIIRSEEDEIESENRLGFLLSQWAVLWGVCANAVDALLKILRLFDFGSNLPKTARTLLRTPRHVNTRSVIPGSYHHFGIANCLKQFFSSKLCATIPDIVEIFVSSDGLPLSKSSMVDCWPISGMLLDSKIVGSPYVFTIGIYVGPEKPSDFNCFYKELVDEANNLEVNGFEWGGKVVKVKIKKIIFDAPARASSLFIKIHNAYFGCGKCVQEGEWKGKIVFPERDAVLRTNESFREKVQEEHHTGTSVLENLNINMVNDVPIDPMHCIYLGVVRKLLHLWLIKGPLSTRMVSRNFKSICETLTAFSHWIPREFSRLSRSLKFIKRFKATEYRQFLLYTGPVALKGRLSSRLYDNFLVLHVAVRILCNKDLCFAYNSYAKKLMDLFVKDFENIYGVNFLTYNVHNLLHLADEVSRCGPLEIFSAFPFENHLQSIKKLVRKCHKPLQQIVKRVTEYSKAKIMRIRPPRNDSSSLTFRQQHHSGPLNGETCAVKQYKALKYGPFYFSTETPKDSCAYLKNGSVIVIENFLRKAGDECVVLAREYKTKRDLYTYPISSSKLDVYQVDDLTDLVTFPLNQIKSKGLRLPLRPDDDGSSSFAVFPLLMQEF